MGPADSRLATNEKDGDNYFFNSANAGSRNLYNFFDSVMTIGQSAKDDRLRYVKQLIIRSDNPGLQTHSMKHYLPKRSLGILNSSLRPWP